MTHTIYQVDSFTREAFKGNPAGVMILESELPEKLMQQIAAEMNLAETAFVSPSEEVDYNIRFFTPTTEVTICGHATLAAAHILYSEKGLDPHNLIRFHAPIGELNVNLKDNWIELDFPSFKLNTTTYPVGLPEALGTDILEFFEVENGWNLALLSPESKLPDLSPNWHQIKQLIPEMLIITSEDLEGNFDYLVRCFAPNVGINEDPVTGSAQCALVPFWHEKTGKQACMAKQVSQRSGILKTAFKGDRVSISGQAVTVFEAKLNRLTVKY